MKKSAQFLLLLLVVLISCQAVAFGAENLFIQWLAGAAAMTAL